MNMPVDDEAHTMSEREFYELKQEAAKYYTKNKVPEKLEEILNSMFYEKPDDVYGRLSKYFETMSLPSQICKIKSTIVMDSTGSSAISCQVFGIVRNESKLLSSTSMSVAPELSLLPVPPPESDEKEPTKENIASLCSTFLQSTLCDKLNGLCPMDQREIDYVLRKWIDEEEDKARPAVNVEVDDNRTPTPSSGPKKKAPSAKGKGKQPDKPVPPYEAFEFRLQGGTAVATASLAVLVAAASFLEKPVFDHMHNVVDATKPITFPVPSMNIISGGKTSLGKLNITKNIFVITKPGLSMEDSVQKLTQVFHQVGKILSAKGPAPPIGITGGYQPSFEKIEQPLDLLQEAGTALGLNAGQDIFIGIECAAHEVFDYSKGKYEIMAGSLKSADELVDYYKDIITRYPAIIALVDPFRKEDREQWPKCCELLSEKCFIIGSDHIYGSTHAVNASAFEIRPSSGLMFNMGGRVTLTDITETTKAVHERKGIAIFGSPAGDVCNAVFSDLAVGLDCDVVRFGAPCRGENIERINRLIEIERYAKDNEISFNYHPAFVFPSIRPPSPQLNEDDNDQQPPSNMSTTASADTKSKKK
uniref:enolase 4-like n=1 Tax=Styela clava TaxID=7725 RepID=UPI00193A3736|nr:enolase 4-like [Styela clava]